MYHKFNHDNNLFHLLFLRRNRIVSVCSPRMAFGNSFSSQPKSFEWTVNPDSIDGILRAGWFVPARWGGEGRDCVFVKIHRNHQYPSQNLQYESINCLHNNKATTINCQRLLILSYCFCEVEIPIRQKHSQQA